MHAARSIAFIQIQKTATKIVRLHELRDHIHERHLFGWQGQDETAVLPIQIKN